MNERERPLRHRAAFLAVYGAGVAGYLWSRGARARQLPERLAAADVALVGVATHKLSRHLAKAKVAEPLRAPFTEPEGRAGPAELAETPRDGWRGAIGELLVCPYCLDQWVATAFAVGLVEAPRPTRFVAGIYSAVALSDFCQIAYRLGQARLKPE